MFKFRRTMFPGMPDDAKITPFGALPDLISVWKQADSNRWWILLLACVPTALMVTLLYQDAKKAGTKTGWDYVYIQDWPEDRSLEEIRKDALVRGEKQRKAEREKQDRYIELGEASGIDMSEIEAENARKRKKEDAEAARLARELNAGESESDDKSP